MSYRVAFTPRAVKALSALPRADQERITAKIGKLADDPRPPGCKALQGGAETIYRIRVGDFRVLYSVKDAELLVLVVDLGNRRDVYRR